MFSDDGLDKGWLSTLAPQLRSELVRAGVLRHLRAGTAIYRQGDVSDGLYSVHRGRLRLISYSANGGGHLQLVAKPGDWFGEVSTLDGGSRQQDAISDMASVLLHVPLARIEEIGAVYPAPWRSIGRLASEHQRQAIAYIEMLVASGPRARVAGLLLMLCGNDFDHPVQISHEQIAANIGVSRQTANSVLREFERQGLLVLGYREIHILEANRLSRVTGMNYLTKDLFRA